MPLRIAICGLNELSLHGAAGVTHVLSILDPGWPEPAAFLAFEAHHRMELRFHDVIEPTSGTMAPESEHVVDLLELGRAASAELRAHILIHCHAGISRSTAAAALLLAQANPIRPAEAIIGEVAHLRPRAWPNLRLLELGDAALNRRGTLVAAAAAQYRRVLDADPEFGRFIAELGRGREVALAERPPNRR